MSGLEQKAMYCYDNKLVKEQRKKCNEDKCKKWHGVDSDNLVWCDDWRIGNCASYNQEDGVPYGEQWVRLVDVKERDLKILAILKEMPWEAELQCRKIEELLK